MFYNTIFTYCLLSPIILYLIAACFSGDRGTQMIGKVFRIGTVRYNWPMSAHASQAFSIAHCTYSEALPMIGISNQILCHRPI